MKPGLAACCALAACRGAPARQEPRAVTSAANVAVRAPAASPIPAQSGEALAAPIIASLGDTAVIALPAPGFDALTREQRLLAYWLSQAGNAGDAIAYDQSYRWNLQIVGLVRGILTHPQAVPEGLVPRIREYARQIYLNHGVHDDTTERKFTPPFSFAELGTAALAAQAAGAEFGLKPGTSLAASLRELQGPMFDPAIDPVRTNKAPQGGQDPLLASAVNFYEGVSLRQLAGFRDHYPLNSRLVNENGKLTEQIYREVQPGLAADRLVRVTAALEQAARLASGTQLQSIGDLIAYFRSGDPDLFRASQREWLKEASTVDYILGFIESYADPRGQKGLWEGFTGFEDKSRTEALKKLASAAQYFEDADPWPAEYKRQSIQVPAASALIVVGGSGDNRPQSFAGVNLPNENAEREKYGSKSFLLPGLDDAVAQVRSLRIAFEFAPPALAAELVRCRPQLRFALVAFHEIVGHASGRVSRKLADAHLDPADLLKENYNTLEEARADLVAHWHAADPKTRELGLIPDAACQALYPQFATGEWLISLANIPSGDRVEEDHLRGDQLMIWWFMQKGAVAERAIAGKRYLVVIDPAKWRAAAGGLLALLQDLKARGDAAQLKTLVHAHATHLNTVWRDDVIARIAALHVPRRVLALPPVLAPVLVDGIVVDAAAQPVRDLDARILADWSWF